MYIFEILQKVGYSFSFAIGENGFIQAIAGSTYCCQMYTATDNSMHTSAARGAADTHGKQ
jgi:hypothetical protein